MGSMVFVIDFMKGYPQLKAMLPELMKFLQLLLTVPVSTSTTKRSFLGRRKLKTFLRLTITQQRLNHLAMLEVHEQQAGELVLDSH